MVVLGQLDLNRESIETLKKFLVPLIHGLYMNFPYAWPGTRLFRGRLGRWNRLSDLSYPPASVAATNRANRAGVPMFYGSQEMDNVTFELSAGVGQEVTVVCWETTADLHVIPVGFTERAFAAMKSPRRHAKWMNASELRTGKAWQDEVHEYLAGLFTRKVGRDSLHDYKLSIAASELLLGSHQVDGLLYPSVALAGLFDNLCLKPRFVDSSLRFVRADLIKVTDIFDGGLSNQSKWLDTAVDLDRQGRLRWRGQIPKWPTGHSCSLVVRGNEWVAIEDATGAIIQIPGTRRRY